MATMKFLVIFVFFTTAFGIFMAMMAILYFPPFQKPQLLWENSKVLSFEIETQGSSWTGFKGFQTQQPQRNGQKQWLWRTVDEQWKSNPQENRFSRTAQPNVTRSDPAETTEFIKLYDQTTQNNNGNEFDNHLEAVFRTRRETLENFCQRDKWKKRMLVQKGEFHIYNSSKIGTIFCM